MLRDGGFSRAVELAVEAYGLRPPRANPELIVGRTSPIMAWNPRFTPFEKRDDTSKLSRLWTPEELVKEREAAVDRGDALWGPTAAVTRYRDGQIALYREAFKSPELLALTIYHETQHWLHAIADEGRGHLHRTPAEMYRRHSEIYARQALAAAAISAPDALRKYCSAVAREYAKQAELSQSKRLTWDQIKTDPSCRDWRGRTPNDHADVPDIPWLELQGDEPLLLYGVEPFLNESVGGMKGLLASADPLWALDELENARQKAEADTDRTLKQWAQGCGLEWAGPEQLDFWVPGSFKGQVRFRFQDEAQARSAMMVAGACVNPTADGPCLDAVEPLRSSWKDPAFRDALLLGQGSGDYMAECLSHFVERYRPGRGFGRVRRTVASYDAFHTERAQQRLRETYDKPEPDQPPSSTVKERMDDPDREWDAVMARWIRRVR